jgi:hypothetical protein
MVFLFTVMTLAMIASLREEAKQAYVEFEREKCKVKDYDWLRARTLHVQGLLPVDRRGDMLKNEIEAMLKPMGGKVLDVAVVPDFQTLFQLETEKKDLEDLQSLVGAQKPHAFTKCMLSCFYKKGSN